MNLNYVYLFAYHETEKELCQLEQRALFGYSTEDEWIVSERKIDPSRSPFIKERLDVIEQQDSIDSLILTVSSFVETFHQFKVVYRKVAKDETSFTNRKRVEKEIGLRLNGTPELKNPKVELVVCKVAESWLIGKRKKSESVWLNHQKKPHQYSTALSTRVARAVVNIAAPSIEGTRVIDPCCGIGTVLIEALSMGINIIGSDNNPLVIKGIRENLAYFGYECDVRLRDLRDIQVPIDQQFDSAVIDLPYNLCSVISAEDQLSMLKQARLITKRLIIVTVEDVKPILKESGFWVKDEGKIVKGSFIRNILVCE